MKRLLMAIAIAGLAVACGDDDGGDTPTPTPDAGDSGPRDSGTDAGIDSGTDAGPADAGPPKVTNVLASCVASASPSTCTGASPVCQAALPFVMGRYPGTGACTASCTKDSECGTGGICPVGNAISGSLGGITIPNSNPPITIAQSLGGTGYCSKGCTGLTDTTSCGTGYACVTIAYLGSRGQPADAGANPLAGMAPFNTPFCIPVIPLDAGVPAGDGGTTTPVDGGMDASGG